MMKKKWLILLFLVLALISVAGIILRRQTATENWVQIKKGPVIEAVYGIGTVTARRSFELKTGVSITLKQVYVEEGQSVHSGDILVESDVAFVSPFSGVVTQIRYKNGETVAPQTPILTLVDLTHCYIRVNLEQQGVIKIRPGLKAVLNFESMRNQKFLGTVKHVYSHNGQFYVDITPESLSKQILPGMTADVAIQTGVKNDVVLVPISALKEGTVRRKRHNKVTTVSIKTGTLDGQMAESLGPELQEGDWVELPNQKNL